MLRMDKLRVVMTSSEAVPFSKTGGLADVSTALAKALDVLVGVVLRNALECREHQTRARVLEAVLVPVGQR